MTEQSFLHANPKEHIHHSQNSTASVSKGKKVQKVSK